MGPRTLGLALVALVAFSLIAALPASAQESLPFQLSLNTTRGVLNVGNIFYDIGLNLTYGARAYYWWVNVSQPSLLAVVQYNTTKVPTPLISISPPNSTSPQLPGPLSTSKWEASQVVSSSYEAVYELTANATLTSPFLVKAVVTFTPTSPVITYTIVVTNLGTAPASTVVAFGIGAYKGSNNWTGAASYLEPNGTLQVTQLANGTSVTSPLAAIAVESVNGSPGVVIGLDYLPMGSSVVMMEGRLFGLSVNTTYVIAYVRTPLIGPGSNYSVTFQAFATGFNAYELAAAGVSVPAYYLFPNYTGGVQRSMGVEQVVSSLKGIISDLNSTVQALKDEVNNLSARLYWYSSQLKLTQRAESYYMSAAHRGGLLSAGLFIAGVVIGVIGGAYFLSPSAKEYVPRRAQAQKGKGK